MNFPLLLQWLGCHKWQALILHGLTNEVELKRMYSFFLKNSPALRAENYQYSQSSLFIHTYSSWNIVTFYCTMPCGGKYVFTRCNTHCEERTYYITCCLVAWIGSKMEYHLICARVVHSHFILFDEQRHDALDMLDTARWTQSMNDHCS